MDLIKLGWNDYFSSCFKEYEKQGMIPGRIITEQKHIYTMYTDFGEFTGEVSGKYRFTAEGDGDFPAVGDWVAVTTRPNERSATIHAVLPRKTRFSRRAAGAETREQILAANFDTVFIVNSLNRDLNLRRIERYLILAWESGACPVIILSKADLCEDFEEKIRQVQATAIGVPVYAISAVKQEGLDKLAAYFTERNTVAVLGSSGVGKSTLINCIAGEEIFKVQEIREDDDKGRHTTTHRQLVMLPSGGMVIDTPGMRELQLWNSEEGSGVQEAFGDVEIFAALCRFRDCTHTKEPGCGVKAALNNGRLDAKRFESYLKLKRELLFTESKQNQAIRLMQKKRNKEFGKLAKNLKKDKIF